MFDAEYELKKYTWINVGIRLIEQIRTALQENLYPLIVAEGESQEKMSKILHSMYLSRGYRSFAKIEHNLFTYGVSFGANDQHWFDLIRKGKTRALYVGLFGDPESDGNRGIRTKAQQISAARPDRRPLGVHFYDAPSAQVWG